MSYYTPPADFLPQASDVAIKALAPLHLATGKLSLVNDVGSTVTEISTDGTMAGNSPTALVTESAVVSYVAGGGGLPVPLVLTSATPYQLQLKQVATANSATLGYTALAEFEINAPTTKFATGTVDIEDVTEAISPTTLGSFHTKGGISAEKNIWGRTLCAADSSGDPQAQLFYNPTHFGLIKVDSSGYLVLSASHGFVLIPDTNKLQCRDTTDANSLSDAAVTLAGGLAVVKKILAGESISGLQLNATATDRHQLQLFYDIGHYFRVTVGVDGSAVIGTNLAVPIYFAGTNQLYMMGTAEATNLTDGSIRTDGGLSVAKSVRIGLTAYAAKVIATSTLGSQLAAMYDATHGAILESDINGKLTIRPTTGSMDLNYPGGGSTTLAADNNGRLTITPGNALTTHVGNFRTAYAADPTKYFQWSVDSNGIGTITGSVATPYLRTTAQFGAESTDDATDSGGVGASFRTLGGAAVAKKLFVGTSINGATCALTSAASPQFRINNGAAYGTIGVTAGGIINVASSNTATELNVAGYLKAVSTTSVQAQLSYDGSNYTNLSTSNTGAFTIAPIGGMTNLSRVNIVGTTVPQVYITYNGSTNTTLSTSSGGNFSIAASGASISTDAANNFVVNNTTDATSYNNGAFHTNGGMSCNKALWCDTLHHYPVWKELNLLAGARSVVGSGPPTMTTFLTYWSAWQFGTGQDNNIYQSIDMPHDILDGSQFDIHIHWAPSTATAGNVNWRLDYEFLQNGTGTINNTPTLGGQIVATPAVAYRVTQTVLETATYSSAGLSPILMLRLQRTGTSADTYGGNAILLGWSMHYQSNVRGDRV